MVPFLIDWGETPHPAASAPAGCALTSLHIEHPEADRLRGIFQGLEIPVEVHAGNAAALVARITSPRGTVELR